MFELLRSIFHFNKYFEYIAIKADGYRLVKGYFEKQDLFHRSRNKKSGRQMTLAKTRNVKRGTHFVLAVKCEITIFCP